jgi:hypothetical protein
MWMARAVAVSGKAKRRLRLRAVQHDRPFDRATSPPFPHRRAPRRAVGTRPLHRASPGAGGPSPPVSLACTARESGRVASRPRRQHGRPGAGVRPNPTSPSPPAAAAA